MKDLGEAGEAAEATVGSQLHLDLAQPVSRELGHQRLEGFLLARRAKPMGRR